MFWVFFWISSNPQRFRENIYLLPCLTHEQISLTPSPLTIAFQLLEVSFRASSLLLLSSLLPSKLATSKQQQPSAITNHHHHHHHITRQIVHHEVHPCHHPCACLQCCCIRTCINPFRSSVSCYNALIGFWCVRIDGILHLYCVTEAIHGTVTVCLALNSYLEQCGNNALLKPCLLISKQNPAFFMPNLNLI